MLGVRCFTNKTWTCVDDVYKKIYTNKTLNGGLGGMT